MVRTDGRWDLRLPLLLRPVTVPVPASGPLELSPVYLLRAMNQALVKGFLESGKVAAASVGVSNPSQEKLAALKAQGVRTFADNKALLAEFQGAVVFLSVKPHILPAALGELGEAIHKAPLVLSLAAGVSLDGLYGMLADPNNAAQLPLVRVMPTIAAAVGASPTGIVCNAHATKEMKTLIHGLLATVGSVTEVPEYQLDAFNALISPGHALTIIDALSDGAVKMGLPRDLAIRLAAETLQGASKLLLATGQHPGVLKNEVCSPGGTTIAGVHALEANGLRNALISAVEASALRSKELDALARAKK